MVKEFSFGRRKKKSHTFAATWVSIVRVCVLNLLLFALRRWRDRISEQITRGKDNQSEAILFVFYFICILFFPISLHIFGLCGGCCCCCLRTTNLPRPNCAVYDTSLSLSLSLSRSFCDGVRNGEVVGGLSGGQGRSRGNHAPLARPPHEPGDRR